MDVTITSADSSITKYNVYGNISDNIFGEGR
jgi:hypothetical protein